MIFSHLHFSGTFRWTSDKDYTLVKEVRFLELYLYKLRLRLRLHEVHEMTFFHTMTVDK